MTPRSWASARIRSRRTRRGRSRWAALSYPLLSDHWPHGRVAALYGVLRGESGVCERAIFVVDKQGKVAYVDIHDISEQPPTDRIMAALDKLK